MSKKEYGVKVLILGHRCYRCEHSWVPRNMEDIPEVCPKCKSPYWKKPKIRFTKKEQNKLNFKNRNEKK
jgi:predicted Zn-ribbon and HTH transcriptional regulator